jgi:hypothetical protein
VLHTSPAPKPWALIIKSEGVKSLFFSSHPPLFFEKANLRLTKVLFKKLRPMFKNGRKKIIFTSFLFIDKGNIVVYIDSTNSTTVWYDLD